jgi:hypothetical protein
LLALRPIEGRQQEKPMNDRTSIANRLSVRASAIVMIAFSPKEH